MSRINDSFCRCEAAVADLRGYQGHAPPFGSNFFHAVYGETLSKEYSHALTCGLAPRVWENPGSTTVILCGYAKRMEQKI